MYKLVSILSIRISLFYTGAVVRWFCTLISLCFALILLIFPINGEPAISSQSLKNLPKVTTHIKASQKQIEEAMAMQGTHTLPKALLTLHVLQVLHCCRLFWIFCSLVWVVVFVSQLDQEAMSKPWGKWVAKAGSTHATLLHTALVSMESEDAINRLKWRL